MAATRQIISHDFSGIGGAAKKNLTGAAIGTIGEGLKDIELPEFSRDQEPNKTSPDLSGLEQPTFNVEAQQLETNINDTLGIGQPLPPKRVGNISNIPAISPTSSNPYAAINIPHVRTDTVGSVQTHLDPTRGSGLPGAGALERGPNQYNILRGESPFNRNGKDKGKEILGRNDKGEVKVKDARGKEVWVTEAPEGSEEKYEQYLQTFHDQRGPDAQPLDIHHAAASGFATPAQSLLAYKSGGRALGKAVGANKRVPTMQDLETIGLADHPLMKKAYPHLFGGETPLERNSPLNRNGRGKLNVDFKGVSQPPPGAAYAGARGIIDGSVASQEIGRMVARNNYKQQVWADKAAEADLEFGKLEVEPSGVSAWDASTEIMAREWKSELGDLLNNKESLDPQEFISKKQEILARSKQFNTAAGMLQKVVGDYNENLDNLSAGTDPDVMDLLNTLNKGGGAIGVSNVNGVPTMTGETNMGKPVSIPISEIASGRGALRFAVKENIQPGLDKITQSLSKIKKDRAIAGGGLATSTIGWDQLKNSAEPQVDSLLNKASTVRSVLADRFGLDYDDVNEQFGGDIDKARAYAKEQIMGDLQQQIEPYQQATTIKRDPRVASQPKQSVVDQRSAADAQAISGQINKIPDSNFNAEGLQQFVGGNINGIQQTKDGSVGVVLSNGKGVKLSQDPKVARQQLARILGIDERHVSQVQSPVKKDGPFKRLTSWMSKMSPFKKKALRPPSKAEFMKAIQNQDQSFFDTHGYTPDDITEINRQLDPNSISSVDFGHESMALDTVRRKGHVPGTQATDDLEKARLGEWWNAINKDTGIALTAEELEGHHQGPRGAWGDAKNRVRKQKSAASEARRVQNLQSEQTAARKYNENPNNTHKKSTGYSRGAGKGIQGSAARGFNSAVEAANRKKQAAASKRGVSVKENEILNYAKKLRSKGYGAKQIDQMIKKKYN